MGGSSPYEEPASEFGPRSRNYLMHRTKSPSTTMMELLREELFRHGDIQL